MTPHPAHFLPCPKREDSRVLPYTAWCPAPRPLRLGGRQTGGDSRTRAHARPAKRDMKEKSRQNGRRMPEEGRLRVRGGQDHLQALPRRGGPAAPPLHPAARTRSQGEAGSVREGFPFQGRNSLATTSRRKPDAAGIVPHRRQPGPECPTRICAAPGEPKGHSASATSPTRPCSGTCRRSSTRPGTRPPAR